MKLLNKSMNLVKNNNIQNGGACAITGKIDNLNCIPEPDVSQYKCPCPNLPLDGTNQNSYPLSNNPKANWPIGFGGKKTKKKIQKGGNCSTASSDCLSKNIEQIGSTPTCNKTVAASQAVSQNAFFDRYCCGYGDAGAANPIVEPRLQHSVTSLQNGGGYNKLTVGEIFGDAGKLKEIVLHQSDETYYTEGFENKKIVTNLKNFLIRKGLVKKNIKISNFSTGGKNLKFSLKGGSKNKKQKGGTGYYLAIEKCPIGGLPVVQGYSKCCPPIFNGPLLKKGGKTHKKKRNIQAGGKCSNFDPNLATRNLSCKQPNWNTNCI